MLFNILKYILLNHKSIIRTRLKNITGSKLLLTTLGLTSRNWWLKFPNKCRGVKVQYLLPNCSGVPENMNSQV